VIEIIEDAIDETKASNKAYIESLEAAGDDTTITITFEINACQPGESFENTGL
jgi:hypothetical protein